MYIGESINTLPRWVEIGLKLETRYYKHRLLVTSRSDQVRPLGSDRKGPC
jgi:hypothetical protein